MKTKYIIILITTIYLTSCGSKKQVAFFPTSEVTYKNYENDILEIRVLGYGANEVESIQDAQIRAIETLFFRGIPNSNISNPLIGYGENKLKMENSTFFRDFFGNKKYLTFISETIPVGGEKQKVLATKIDRKKKKTKEEMVDALVVAVDIYVNVKTLRRSLEENDIIKKFGY